MKRIDKIITDLKLEPHPEGGYFRETYRSTELVAQDNLGANYVGERNFSTCIYFLLKSDLFSAFHRIQQDEIWHFYDGSPICLHMISSTGVYSFVLIGRNLEAGQIPQFVVPGGCWFAANVINEADYSLVGCTVSPGFDFRDFELAQRTDLIKLFPNHEKIIVQLTRYKMNK